MENYDNRISVLFGFSFIYTTVTNSPLSLQLRAVECTPLAGMRVCQVCRGIRGHSSSVKLCRRMLLSAMLGISSPARRQRDAGLWENWSGVKCCQHWPLWDPSPSPPPSTLWEPRLSLHNGAKKEAAVWKSTLPQLQFRLQQSSLDACCVKIQIVAQREAWMSIYRGLWADVTISLDTVNVISLTFDQSVQHSFPFYCPTFKIISLIPHAPHNDATHK